MIRPLIKLFALFSVCMVSLAYGQGVQQISRNYKVIDLLNKDTWKETWTAKKIRQGERVEVTKQVDKKFVREIELFSEWQRVRISPNDKKRYVQESLVRDVVDIGPGERTFGNVKILELGTNILLDQAAVFVEKNTLKVLGVTVEKLLYRMYFQNGRTVITRQDYVISEYPLPLKEEVLVIADGVVLQHVIYAQE